MGCFKSTTFDLERAIDKVNAVLDLSKNRKKPNGAIPSVKEASGVSHYYSYLFTMPILA